VSLATTFCISGGERNWPFFTFTACPVFAAATSRSVCRQRNAGICRRSTPPAAVGCACAARGCPSSPARRARARPRHERDALLEPRARARCASSCDSPCRSWLEDVAKPELPAAVAHRLAHVQAQLA
jgi:hypothetical protein